MTDPRDDDLAPSIDESTDPEQAVNQQFVHALLRTLEEDPAADQDRIRRLMRTIKTGEADSRESARRISPAWGFTSGIAAAILLCLAIIFLNGTQQSATATVYSSIDAMRLAGDRTYTVSFAHQSGDAFERSKDARLDIRSDNQYLVRLRTPEGHMLVAGANADGDWMLRRDGTVIRSAPAHHRPRFIDQAGGSLLLASIDGLLSTLPETYELEMLEPEALAAENPVLCDRVRAVPRDAPDPDLEEIDLWIDPDSRLVRRIDMVTGSLDPASTNGPRPPRLDGPHSGRPPPPFDRDRPGGARPGGPPNRPPYAVRFDLEKQETLPENWFSPDTHAQPRPPA